MRRKNRKVKMIKRRKNESQIDSHFCFKRP